MKSPGIRFSSDPRARRARQFKGSIPNRFMTRNDLIFYCREFQELNVNKHYDRGEAPHKPILLLSIAEMFDRGLISQNRIYPTRELLDIFLKYWRDLASEKHTSSIFLPFYHLTGDGFWYLKMKEGYEHSKPTSWKKLREIVVYAYLDNDLFLLFQDKSSRNTLIQVLLDKWFAGKKKKKERKALYGNLEGAQFRPRLLLEPSRANPQLDDADATPQASLPPDLAPELLAVWDAIAPEPTPFDQIVAICTQNPGHVSSALTRLELMGLVTQLPGMQYRRI